MLPDARERVLRAAIAQHEGFKPYVYPDSRGYLTIGYGHLVDRRLGGKLSQAACEFILGEDIDEMEKEIAEFPWFANQDDVRKEALIEISFNLGLTKLLHFPHFLASMVDRDYKAAAANLRGTKWHSEVGETRATYIENLIESGKEPNT